MKDGFIRAAAATPKVVVADVEKNIKEIELLIRQSAEAGCGLVVFPELAITAYSCGDLFRDRLLISAADDGLRTLMKNTIDLDILCVVGLPVAHMGRLYNCGAVFHRGRLLGLAAKSFIPNYSEFYEARYFSPAVEPVEICCAGQSCPMGKNLIFSCENLLLFSLGVELCEDVWTASPPSIGLAQNGATLIANLSSSDEIIGKAEYRRDLIRIHSGRILSGYIYADSGPGESTTDMVFAGHDIIAENGSILAESKLFSQGLTVADLDLERLSQERLRIKTWQNGDVAAATYISFAYEAKTLAAFETVRRFPKLPFVPSGDDDLKLRCESILNLQAQGLCTRLRHIGCKTALLGLSGGLDSTLALLVTVRAFDLAGLDRKGIHAVSMPCFGTTQRTKNNASEIAGHYGVSFSEIPIDKAVLQHFEDIGQDVNNHDIAYENSQARERTQVLMDLANRLGGIVVGTGDLSELALGWATYNGDHMSMYAVNSSIPKTLVRHLVRYESENSPAGLQEALRDILDTPVSPELLPPKNGVVSQKTEDIVGPYELHDYFLYYMLRFGFVPGKIFRMACRSFENEYGHEEIKKWLKVFYKRFFSQQFKRSCLPDGPKVGSVSLSPRGDFRMPSDASANLWLEEIDQL